MLHLVSRRSWKNILHGIDGVINLLDDIVICAATKQEHDRRLEIVLKRLEAYNGPINAEKTVLGADAVDYVRHHVSVDGVRLLLSNVNAILRADPPTSLKQLR